MNAEVREAVNKESGETVAIKVISKLQFGINHLNLVKNEIEVLKVCQHPGIIKLLDHFEDINNIYIVMEVCPGGNLMDYFEMRGLELTEERASNIVKKLADSISYLHSYGIAHRDLKLENILMVEESDESDIKLLDFGLSKIMGPDDSCTDSFGTLVKD